MGPPQRLTSVVTAADKPPHTRSPHVGRMTSAGRSPGSRIIAPFRLPGLRPVACGRDYPPTVAGAAADLANKSRPYRVPKGPGRLVTGPPAPMPIEIVNACRVKLDFYIKISLYCYCSHDRLAR